jgi:16S rRNA (uracil1498-N3)-methyltransferase
MHRFYLPNIQDWTLRGEEAHHCIHVLRMKNGDTLTVFDGTGQEAHCAIAGIESDTVRLKSISQSRSKPLPCRITLAQAVPKKNMDWIVQKATELGAAEIVPLISERTIVQLDADAPKVDRWRAIAMDACKQCGNNWLPVIHPPQKAGTFLQTLPKADLKLIASLQPDARPLRKILAETKSTASVLILIGPEGDFTPAELAAAKSAGCLPLSLGPLVLRADTAAVCAMSSLHYELQTD